jgi:hypothetical protein
MTTLHSPEYYARFSAYLEHASTKSVHRRMFNAFLNFIPGLKGRVLDLGCSPDHYFQQLAEPAAYLGLDGGDPPYQTIVPSANYRDCRVLNDQLEAFQPDVVVSLFGTELTAPHLLNQQFYADLFNHPFAPKAILVSGFRRDGHDGTTQVITVEDGLPVFQTTEPLCANAPFQEFQFSYCLPSTLFGQHTIEVWRLLLPANLPIL